MALTSALRDLVGTARADGWASGTASMLHLRFQASLLLLDPVTSRQGQDRQDVLHPITSADAPKRSLSAAYGRGAQPLHTDGAHLTAPPDIVILASTRRSTVATMLWRHDRSTAGALHDDLSHGLFTVDDGKTHFLAPAYARGRLRFDPGCMTPADSRARRVAAHFRDVLDSATSFNWTDPDQVLVIDNRTVLHARADAQSDPDRELQRLMFRIAESEHS
ncbi:TauD/TfdA family dioxygenase [Jiangella alkaliphila]|uniref:Taurine catabolism dioxygenase TauD, TfdA family n=1 Tax=Jiangella alkaliphila TaxID=419479 RepID=A0A1H2H106_9ACTN|nr:TauD/TfdA family dioxygenase [Jiangella alkaliphila]SDU25513.1 Taurine catabolism dioxygenase TauD, TfdA family [Jiangella alkaliphila]